MALVGDLGDAAHQSPDACISLRDDAPHPKSIRSRCSQRAQGASRRLINNPGLQRHDRWPGMGIRYSGIWNFLQVR